MSREFEGTIVMTDERVMRWTRRLSVVQRWGVLPTLRRQNVAEHSYHVAVTAKWLLTKANIKVSATFMNEVLLYALEHDIWEAASGDNPSPSKGPKDYSKLGPVELVVKLADLIESFWFLCEEEAMGNRAAIKTVKNAQWNEITKCAKYFPTKDGLSDLLSKISTYGSRSFDVHPVMEAYIT